MTRPTSDYLSASPWEALLQLVNDNCGLHLEPASTTLTYLESLSDDGETKVTLTASRSDNSLKPPFAYRVFKYYRLDLAVVLSDYDGGFIDPENDVHDTRWVMTWLSNKTGIAFDLNDFQHVTVRNMETFVLKAHPMSLRWYGSITLTIAPSVDHARLEEPGTYRLRMKPGTYSVLMVGGGSGGTGRYVNNDDIANGRMILGGGGGSGFAVKTRIEIKEGDSIVATVGAGGEKDAPDVAYDWRELTVGNRQDSIADTTGKDSYLVHNKKEECRAFGARFMGAYTGTKPWVYYNNYVRSGSCGASGGGKSGYFKGATTILSKIVSIDPGTPATNGGDDGADGVGVDLGSDNFPWTKGSAGTGAGKGYYTNILNSIDPDITHDIVVGSTGGKAVASKIKLYIENGEYVGTINGARAGGGGGLGQTYHGIETSIEGKICHLDGTGYGAGGGGGNPGINGFVSIVKIK